MGRERLGKCIVRVATDELIFGSLNPNRRIELGNWRDGSCERDSTE